MSPSTSSTNTREAILSVCLSQRTVRVSKTESGFGGAQRVSPIFAVVPKRDLPDLSRGEWHVFFVFASNPHTLLALVSARHERRNTQHDPTLVDRLWFSLGQASVVLITQEALDIESLLAVCSDSRIRWSGYERWRVDGGVMQGESISIHPVDVVPIVDLLPYSSLDPDLKLALQEAEICLRCALDLASRYAEELLPSLYQTQDSLNLVICTAKQIYEKESGSKLSDSHQQLLRLHTDTVEIGASLAYVISQSFAGTAPILENPCPFLTHGLLGIGVAVRGVSALHERVAKEFSNPRIDEMVKRDFIKYAALPDLPEPGDIWHGVEGIGTVDDLAEGASFSRVRPSLTLFSGRRGFRESQYSVSVPLHSLARASEPRWTLETLTHEFLHEHVRAVLAALLSRIDEEQEQAEESNDLNPHLFSDVDATILDRLHQRAMRRESLENRRDSMRAGLIHYVKMADAAVLGAAAVNRQGPKPVRVLLQEHFRQINEIMVHCLDLQYFYQNDHRRYIVSIWSSWAAVPVALERSMEYLLRTIVAVSFSAPGSYSARFEKAVERTREGLESIKNQDSIPLIVEAIRLLKDSDSLGQLRTWFMPNAFLADLTVRCLLSNRIAGSLVLDDRLTDSGKYDMKPCSFMVEGVINPVAFIQGMRGTYSEMEEKVSDEYLSAWSFLVLAGAAGASKEVEGFV